MTAIARRIDKHRLATTLSNRIVNPMMRAAVRAGLPTPSVAILETTGRKSGQPRRTPVGNGLVGDTFWIVTEHGRRAAYVKNIQANPRVRVRIGRRWRTGTAHLMPDDDARERQRRMPNRMNSAVVRLMHTELLTVRVDLDD
jgi:deazaflavin-dependent oxidoreductase (nitroreductase family)